MKFLMTVYVRQGPAFIWFAQEHTNSVYYLHPSYQDDLLLW